MADKDDKHIEEAAPKKKRSRMTMTMVLVLGVALIEGIAFYAATKMFGGGPQTTYGADSSEGNLLEGDEVTDAPSTVEISVVERFKVPNDKRGRPYIYDFDVVIKVPGLRAEEAKEFVESRKGEISDRIARIVRADEPSVLHEAELKTLRMQIQHTLGEIAGDQDMVAEVLIPRCVPVRAD